MSEMTALCYECVHASVDEFGDPCYDCLTSTKSFKPHFQLQPQLEALKMEDSKATQVGGSHYQMPIQPIDFIVKNNIPYREANVIKYVVRHRQKNGREDLKKAIHYLQMIMEDYDNDTE